jgi:peptidoglycan/xylan/chitin deacetylase (PgdA/CDA1 family)
MFSIIKKLVVMLLILFVAILQTAKAQVKIPDKIVVLTFDDAAASHARFVAPILKQYGFGATFFVCEFVPDFADTSKYMTWSEIQQLSKAGFEIGNHTHHHRHVNKLSKQAINEDLEYIEKKCDSLGIPKPVSFAYPAYDTSSKAIEVLKERGYLYARIGSNLPYFPLKDDPYLIHSFTTTGTDKMPVLKAIQQADSGRIVVLTIHGVPDYAHDWVTTPPELFKEYMQYLFDNHYKVIALKDIAPYLTKNKN